MQVRSHHVYFYIIRLFRSYLIVWNVILWNLRIIPQLKKNMDMFTL